MGSGGSEKPVFRGGGYFFTLPGVQAGDYLGSSMLAASQRHS
jgi:deferrochelatase/peroxidase EfeB